MDDEDLRDCFAGSKLHGDDFSPERIAQWFESEKEGYANLGAKDRSRYVYPYRAINQRHLFRHLPARLRFRSLLSVGGAYGDEVRPIVSRVDAVTIVEPSSAFVVSEIEGVPVRYLEPCPDGTLPFADGAFDLLICIGVLHHIPNVSHVLREFARCLEPGGFALLREPTVSMGDWRRPRPGLTPNERGLPLEWFRRSLGEAGFQILRETRGMFPLVRKMEERLGGSAYNRQAWVALDEVLSSLFSWNHTYHATRAWQKLQPAAVFYVLRREVRPRPAV